MQALAQSTIQDLHNKLAARTGEAEECQRRLQAARSMAAGEVAGLQDQIQQLSHQLQLQDQRHVKVCLTASMSHTALYLAMCLVVCLVVCRAVLDTLQVFVYAADRADSLQHFRCC